MICNDCNSESFDVMIQDDMGFPIESIELDQPVTHCPFCGTNLEWGNRGGFDLHDEDRLEI